MRKESVTKWSKYKLTVPVKRSEIISGNKIFIQVEDPIINPIPENKLITKNSSLRSSLLWLVVGMIFAGIGVAFSVMLHGFPFDRNTDIFMMFGIV
mgnify:CR=1 FL=1